MTAVDVVDGLVALVQGRFDEGERVVRLPTTAPLPTLLRCQHELSIVKFLGTLRVDLLR